MITDKIRIKLDKLLLALIFVILSSSTIAWTLADKTPPAWDPADHLSAGYDYYRALAHLDFAGLAHEFFVEPRYYAPFAHLVTAIVFLIFGASRLTGIFVNLVSLAALLGAVSWIARRLYAGEPQTPTANGGPVDLSLPMSTPVLLMSVLAALLASCYHFPAWLLHDAFLDYPLTAMVALGFALLIYAGDFQSRRRAIMFGFAAGLGMLTKQTFPFFFILPALYVAGRILWLRDRRAIINLLISAAILIAIAAVWYVPHLDDVIAIYRVNRQAAINENEAPLFGFVSNVYYTYGLLSSQMQLPFGLLFLAGLSYSLTRRAKESVILYLWILSGIGIFTLIANKDMRYTVPVLPATAILSVCWLAEFKKRRTSAAASGYSKPGWKMALSKINTVKIRSGSMSVLATAIAVWAFISFFNAQWPAPGQGFYVELPHFRWMIFARNYFALDHRPLAEDWSVPEIVRTVARFGAGGESSLNETSNHSKARARASRLPQPEETISPPTRIEDAYGNPARPLLGVVVNLPYLNPSSVALYARLMAHERAGPPLILVDWLVVEPSRDRIEGCDYLLVRTGLDHADWVAPIERHVEKLISEDSDRFERIASFPIPLEQAEAVVYRLKR